MTKLVFISDTHNNHNQISHIPCDIIFHTGDATNKGKMGEITPFLNWFAGWPAKYKIFVPGNHERYCWTKHEAEIAQMCKDRGIQLLVDSLFIANLGRFSISIYGAPLLVKNRRYPDLPNWCDILLTHEPAKGRLDLVTCRPLKAHESPDGHLGSSDLINVNCRIHACGHIHQGHGQMRDILPHNKQEIYRINSSMCDELSSPPKLIRKPIVIEYEETNP